MAIIEDKCRILIKKGDYYHLSTIKLGKTTNISKTPIQLDSLIGHPFGTYFEVVNRTVNKIEPPSFEDDDLLNSEDQQPENSTEDATREEIGSTCDQIKVSDNPHVTKEEIMSMKAGGVDADEMIKTIVSKNAAFKDRTDYSKTKYIKKKLKRHKLIFQVLKPNSRLISRAIFNMDSKKLLNLSPLDVANILYKCGLFPHCRVIVCDGTGGLIVSVMLEKLLDNITIIEFFTAEHPKRDGNTFFSFDNSLFKNVYPLPVKYANETLPLDLKPHEPNGVEKSEGKTTADQDSNCSLESSKTEITDVDFQSMKEEPSGKRQKMSDKANDEDTSDEVCNSETVDERLDTKTSETSESCNRNGSNEARSHQKQNNNRIFLLGPKHEKGHQIYIQGKLDCLLLVSKFDPLMILKHCYPKLAPSRPVVIFHSCLDVIRNCAEWLKDEKRAVNIEVCDVFSREYQVLPNRTRPTMKPEETTGYCLSAIKIVNDL